MKHVRQPLPDVRAGRTEVSAALAAVVDKATAKRTEDRYPTDAAVISDLEDVLAIETARAGSASGEVTSVLNTIPATKRRRVPLSVRHRTLVLVVTSIAVLAAAGATVWLITRSRHERGHRSTPVALTPITLCPTCAQGFNPLGSPTNEAPNPQRAIDGDPSTAWSTQQYYSRELGKPGTGLYVDTGTPMPVRQLRILTDTPGFTASVYARTSPPPLTWPNSGWTPVSTSIDVASDDRINLNADGHAYRYFLVWITSLGGHESVDLNEVKLLR
jgi:serine/threonine-protein kinase